MGNLVLRIILSALLILPSPVWGALPPPPERQPELVDRAASLEALVKLVNDLRPSIDRSAFDTEALLDKLDYDPERIKHFVTSEVSFEQYTGTLRGAGGTLVGRAGNALDQSILLAKLLKDAGVDARIAQGELNPEQSRILLQQLSKPATELPAIGDPDEFARALKPHAGGALSQEQLDSLRELLEGRVSSEENRLRSRARQAADEILEQLRSADVQFDAEGQATSVSQEARQYFWVQTKETAGSPWEDVHPAFGDSAVPDEISPTAYFSDEIPTELQHRFRFQVFNEVRRKNTLETIAITAPWERPVANLTGVPLTFGIIPNTMLGSGMPPLDLEDALLSASYFAPILGDAPADGAQYFDLAGNTIDPMVAGSQSAGVFENINRAFGDAIGQIGGESSIPTLTAQWIEFTLIEPGGAESSYRRMTFDRIGAAARAAGEVPEDMQPTQPDDVRAMIQRHTIMISSGRIAPGLALDRSFERMAQTFPALIAVLRQLNARITPTPEEMKRLSAIPSEWPGHLPFLTLLNEADRLTESGRSYRSGPALIVHRTGLAPTVGAVTAMDIVSNPRRSFSVDSGQPQPNPAATLIGGVWETLMEGRLLEPSEVVYSTQRTVSAAISASVPLTVIEDTGGVSNLSYPSDTRVHIERDLARKYAVVLPERPVPDQLAAWWRVDPVTGETLGQLDDGRGSIIEYLDTITFGISVAFLAAGWWNCISQVKQDGDYDKATCCVTANFLMFGVGYLGGALASAKWVDEAAPLMSADFLRSVLAELGIATGSVLWDLFGFITDVCGALGY